MKNFRKKKNGFTILEVLMVLLLIGIISSVLLNRFDGTRLDLFTQCDIIKSHLRFAQLRSLNTSESWGICFKDSQYWLFKAEDIYTPILLPGMNEAILRIKDQYGLTIELSGPASTKNFWVGFDSLGRPGTSFANQKIVVGKDDLSILISNASSSNSQALTIVAQTGYIP